jgi:mannosylglycerate hydrolase
MKPDSSHIKQIKVVCNTHWDREFRRSFEKTRRRLLTMLDTTLDILEHDPWYHSFTMDSHSLMIEDYLEMRPERREQVEKFVREGRLVIGPYYTLAEEFSIGHEALVRNLIWGRKTVKKYGGKTGTVAYTPSSWGQTGQLPQILADFGLNKMMFYRGISHHECDAEFIWKAPDGTCMLGSRFALYARYNWYYQVYRPLVASGRVFEKDYIWGERQEAPFRYADGLAGEDLTFDLKDPEINYDQTRLKEAVEKMVETEGRHFTTEVFLAMHGHDISAAHPLDAQMILDAAALLKDKYSIEQTNLEKYWEELIRHLDIPSLPILEGERRSYLKEGKWTFLFPGTISARSSLKQADFQSTVRMVYLAEPLAALSSALGAPYPKSYLDRGWSYLLANHTHDANGGCAPDAVCQDMQYRYRKVNDIADIVAEDAMTHICLNLTPEGQGGKTMQLAVFNPLPFTRSVLVMVDLEIPREFQAKSFALQSPAGERVVLQPIASEKSSSFVDNMWEVPTILESSRVRAHAALDQLPPLGYRIYQVEPLTDELWPMGTLLTAANTLENEHLKVRVNANGSVDIVAKATERVYRNLNYLSDQGECGNAWKHVAPQFDRIYTSLGVPARISAVESGPLVSSIEADYEFPLPVDYADGNSRNALLVSLPVKVLYRLEKGSRDLKVRLEVENLAQDHWLRVNFPSELDSKVSWADSHFDVLSRDIHVPDSTGWVEKAGGTHPLRTFVALEDGKDLLAVMPKGFFEYEIFEDGPKTLSLTLIRACRIKLAVSEEKQTELPDPGVQCPGTQGFEYSIYVGEKGWAFEGLLARAAERYTPVRAVQIGRGKGTLPLEAGLFALENPNLHVTCVKHTEEGSGLIVRLFNSLTETQVAEFKFGKRILAAWLCRMDESEISPLPLSGDCLNFSIEPKKIRTFKFIMESEV